MFGAMAVGYGRRAHAACSPTGPGTYTCAGAITTSQILQGSPLTVTTTAPFSLLAATGTGISLKSYSGITFSDSSGSVIRSGMVFPDGGGDGIYARQRAGPGNLTITTNSAVTGAYSGIYALNHGYGLLSITSTSTAKGFGGLQYGIAGRSYSNLASGVRIYVNNAYGGFDGVDAETNAGSVLVKTTGNVAGNVVGVRARNNHGNGLTIVTAGSVTGGYAGVAGQMGNGYLPTDAVGPLSITVTGRVTAKSLNTPYSTGYGVLARNYGLDGSSTTITVSSTGFVQGKTAGIAVNSPHATSPFDHEPITITNNGTVQNLSSKATDLAITTTGSPATITNNGLLTGVVDLSAPKPNSMTNNGTWNTAGGVNNFGRADVLTNATAGTIYAAAASGASGPTTTKFNGLASFVNAGLLTAHNGVVGDQIVVNGNFIGAGGSIGLDTRLGGDASPTDKLIVNGNASGSTNLFIYNTGGLGALTMKGIEVVEVGGTSTASAFQLGQIVAAGAFAYNLAEGSGGWFLQSTFTPPEPPTPPNPPKPPPPVLPSFRAEVPVYLAVPELANMLGFAMIDNYDARMGGEPRFGSAGSRPAMGPPPCSSLTPAEAKKAMLTGRGCATPADEAELTLEHLPLGWARVFGVTGEQQPGGRPSASLSTPFLNGKGPQFNASYGGFQVGADLLGGSAYGGFDKAGLYLGYANAFANVDQVYSAAKAGSVTVNAYSGGAYWTHVAAQGWWLDGVAQATWFEDAKGSTPNTGMSVSGSALTVSLESGYPSRPYPNWTVEPQGQLIFQYARMGSGADAFGVTSFGETNDFRGRIGVKASYVAQNFVGGVSPATFWGRINLWHDFLASPPSATFATLTGTFSTTIDGTLGQTFGEIDLGVDAHLTQTVSLFGFGFYDHSVDGGSSWSAGGKAGVKIQF